jgi:hypothetical protein
MKTNFGIKLKIAKMVVAVAALAPLMAFAGAAHAQTAPVSAVCMKADKAATTLDTLISEKESRFSESKAARAESLAASRKESDKALYAARVAANATYAAEFKALLAQASTDEERAAVASFKKTVMQAVETRRANVDLAIKNYRAGVDAILASRAGAYASALATLRTQIDDSLDETKFDCAPNTNIRNARTKFQGTIASLSAATEQLAALAATRDEKLAAIDAKFDGTLEASSAKLKAVLKDY